MAKRKSITGIKKKRAASSRARSTPSKIAQLEHSENANDDVVEKPEAGRLLQLRVSTKGKGGGPTRRPEKLESRVEHVSSKIIENNWAPLDEDGQQAVKQLIEPILLPVLANFPTEKTKQEAQEVLDSIQISLFNRLPRTPFPKGTVYRDFNPESVRTDTRDLRDRIDSTATAITRLRDDILTTRRMLATEEQTADTLTQELDSESLAAEEPRYLSIEGLEITDRPTDINMTGHPAS